VRFHSLIALSLLVTAASVAPCQTAENIVLDTRAPTTPFPHFWEKTFGSGRAIVSLRESYRGDLRQVKAATNFESIRFHGILMDEVGVYDPDRKISNPGVAAEEVIDHSVYNFSYVDQIYDGLLANRVRPFVELSFMPKKMAADPLGLMPNFWYHPNVSPPADYAAWDAMIAAFARHLISRYSLEEVSKWKFEVWNEPNLEFWAGDPRQATYFSLYEHTARTLKAVSPLLHVGGPSTALAAWVAPFLEFVHANNIPIDFVSTHIYANDDPELVFGIKSEIPLDRMVYLAVKKVHEQILASPYPQIPLYISEFNASWRNNPNITDSPFMGPWLSNTIRQCDGLTERMAYWDFSDVFEEQGVTRTPFGGGYGLIAADNILKPSFNIFAALHKLGVRRLALTSDSALATTTSTGIALALWSYAPPRSRTATYIMPTDPAGPVKHFHIEIKNISKSAAVQVLRIDDQHSNVLRTYNAMGRPPGDLTRDEITALRAAATMSPAEYTHLSHGSLDVDVPAHGLAILLIGRQ
jgi:xylan 1,4-beta-xylosidase